MKQVLGFTWIGWLNIVLLQWLFFRLMYTVDEQGGKPTSYSLIFWIVPVTGWWANYIYLGRERQWPRRRK